MRKNTELIITNFVLLRVLHKLEISIEIPKAMNGQWVIFWYLDM